MAVEASLYRGAVQNVGRGERTLMGGTMKPFGSAEDRNSSIYYHAKMPTNSLQWEFDQASGAILSMWRIQSPKSMSLRERDTYGTPEGHPSDIWTE